MTKLFFEIAYENYAKSFGIVYDKDSPCKEPLWDVVILVESILNANTNDLVVFFNKCYEDDIMLLPLWIRLLIFKLYILENPDDKEFIKIAISDLAFFAPDANDAIKQFENMLGNFNG
jgi:hypothetical protein